MFLSWKSIWYNVPSYCDGRVHWQTACHKFFSKGTQENPHTAKGGKNRFNRHMFRHLQNFLYAIPSPRHTKGMIVSFHHGSVKSLTLLVILIILYQFFLQFQPNIYGYKKNKLLYNSRNTFCTAHSFQKQKFRIYLCALIGLRAPTSVGCHTVPPANALLDAPYKPSLSKERWIRLIIEFAPTKRWNM